jgi:hypothetical protein
MIFLLACVQEKTESVLLVGDDSPILESDTAIESTPPQPTREILYGQVADSGYGRSLFWDGSNLYVGAPYENRTGAVYLRDNRLLSGQSGERLGIAFAMWEGEVVVGSGSRVLKLDGSEVLKEEGCGVLAGDWASTATGAVSLTGERKEWGQRPDALAIWNGTLVAGFSRGVLALRREEQEVGHLSLDGQGYALTVGDADGDGTEELLVGAPGAGAVIVYDENLLEKGRIVLGSSRFGAALAVAAPGRLLVGAPMAGLQAQGAVYEVQGLGTPVLLAEGEQPDDLLGTSLVAGADWWAAGAPGAVSSTGRVLVELIE